jgi:O-acetylserine/cysteine efflux transporter
VKTRLSGRDLALTLIVVAIWGYAFVPIKVALAEVPPFALAALRFLCAAVPMCFFVRPPQMPLRAIVAYGFAIGVLQFGLLFLGIQLGMPAGLSSVVIQMQVFFTIGLAVVFAGDHLSRQNVLGAAVATLGIALLGAHKLALGATATFAGFMLVIGAAAGWGIGNVIAKRAAATHDADMFALVVWSSLVPPLPLALASYLLEGGPAVWDQVRHMGLLSLACILFMAYVATLFCYATWNRMLHRYPTPLISPFGLLIPVSGIASGVVFLGESLAPMQILGAALVLAGLLVNVYGTRIVLLFGGRRAEPASREP